MKPDDVHDQILQTTCKSIVTTAAKAIDDEPAESAMNMKMPGGPVVGRQIKVDATEKDGPLNTCRLAVLDATVAPEGEVCRLEFEHERQTKFGTERVYSIQSVRKRGGELVLLENFLANTATEVREADFRRIESETYAQNVLKTVVDWTLYRRWQLQELHRK